MNGKFVLPEPQTGVSLAFLRSMFETRWDLAAIPPDGGRPEFKTFTPTEDDEAERWIDERQGFAGIYYHANLLRGGFHDRKATKSDITKVLHLHADIDVNDENTLHRIRSFVPAPTVIVFSGGGFQPLWTLREPSIELERAERINAFLAKSLGGDNCQNVDRLLRLPGTINMPNAKKRAAGRVWHVRATRKIKLRAC